tara:strand:+ start:255 stop:692 length:438 start_codon:yes stop_codon:yes gene_type:complete
MASVIAAADPVAEKVIEKTTDTEKSSIKSTQHSIAHFLIDFNVVPVSIGFLIAYTFRDFMQVLAAKIMQYLVPSWGKNDLSSPLLTLILTVILCMLFVKYIFYSMFQNEDIKKEIAVKDAVEETKKDIAKTKIANNPEIINKMYK